MPTLGEVEKVVPLKVNAFEHLRQANAQLSALFPYMHPGAIIPCTSQFEVEAGDTAGYFVHENTVDEVGMLLGSEGRGRVGDVWRGPKVHGVGFASPEAYTSAVVITQRQNEQGEQEEAVEFKCEQCSASIFRFAFSGAHKEDAPFAPLPTTDGSYEATTHVATPEQRTCKACGHENAPFPTKVWNWHMYMKNTRIAQKAYKALKEALA